MMAATKSDQTSRSKWIQPLTLIVSAIYFLILMEWLFFSTKPSFMSVLGAWERILILFATPIPFVLAAATLSAIVWGIGALLPSGLGRRVWVEVSRGLISLILGAVAILLLDNFTITIFGLGIRDSGGIVRLLYIPVFLKAIGAAYDMVRRLEAQLVTLRARRALYSGAFVLLMLSLAAGYGQWSARGEGADQEQVAAGARQARPRILLISSDGLDASNMSLYGYARDTTPFLRQLRKSSLLLENAFSNAPFTGGSTMAMLTGKLSTQTRHFYPPDILRGIDSYQHLPGILRTLGYTNVDISIRHYADPYDLNLRAGFHRANFRDARGGEISEFVSRWAGQEGAYFASVIDDRLRSRLLHIFAVEDMSDAHSEATGEAPTRAGDLLRIKELKGIIESTPGPLFVRLHLMSTHGAKFHPRKKVFSAGLEQNENWMVDFYDDAIREFDARVEDIVDFLSNKGLWDETLLIVTTDHGQRYTTTHRIPLLIRFPNGSHSGVIKTNTQLFDIGPTILDYVGRSQPSWMRGESLIQGPPSKTRPIWSSRMRTGALGDVPNKVDYNKLSPPFFLLGSVGVIVCDQHTVLNVRTSRVATSTIKGHTDPCEEGEGVPREEVLDWVYDHLEETYDVPSDFRAKVGDR